MSDVQRLMSPDRQSLPIPESACQILFDGAADQRDWRVTFRLRRRRCGVEIWFMAPTTFGAFSWNASITYGVEPRSFEEARAWVAAFGARYGQDILEKKRERRHRKPKLTLVKP